MKKYRHALTPKHRSWGYKKPRRTKKKKSIFRFRFFWLGLLFLVILGTVVYFVVFSSIFKIKEIDISGNQKTGFEELKNLISNQIDKNFLKRSIFLTNLKEINEMLLEKFPQIAKVNLNRKLPNVLAVQIEERNPVAIFSQALPSFPEENLGGQGQNYFYIDKEGIIFEEISEIPQMLKIKKSTSAGDLELGKKIIEKELIAQILKINSELKDNLKIPLTEFLIISERRLNAKTSEGWEIYFNPERDLEWQLTQLSVLLKERIPPDKRRNIEYIDLRFEKIYIFPETYGQ